MWKDEALRALEKRLAELGDEVSTERIDVLNELAWETGFRDVERTEALAREAIDDARALSYPRGIAWGLLNSGFHDYITGDYEAAMEKSSQALPIFEEIQDRAGIGAGLMGSGLVSWSLGDFERAVSALHRSAEIFNDLGDEEQEGWALTSLGGVYENLGDLEKAVECHRRALELFRAIGMRVGEGRALTGLGVVHQRQGDLEQALERQFESLALLERTDNAIGVSRALNDIGTIHLTRGDLEKAEEYLSRALQIRDQSGNVPAKITSLLDLGKVYVEKGAVGRALELLEEALALSERTKTKPKLYRAHEALSEAYEKSGDFRRALAHHREFQRLKEEVLGEEAATRLRNLQIRLQSESVAQLRDAQAKLIQAARMATLGKLAAGIAHEVNTPVGVIQASADVAARMVAKLQDENDARRAARLRETRESLEAHRATLARAAKRLSEIVSSLKRLTNLDGAEVGLLDVNDALDSILALVEPQWGERIRVSKDFAPLPELRGYQSEINQALLTLLLNAGESIDDAGTISVTTKRKKERVEVAIADSGRGMSPDQLSRIFDVGFSKRGGSIRLQVGLAHVKATVEKHGGEIDVKSEPGRGTTFSISLPAQPI